MIPSPSSWRASRPARLRRIAIAFVALLAATGWLPTASAEPQAIHRIRWFFSDAAAGRAAPGTGIPFTLPMHWTSGAQSGLRAVSMQGGFILTQVPTGTWAVLISGSSEGGTVFVNGHFVGAVPAETAMRHVAWHRPWLFAVAPSDLIAGDNQLQIRTRYGPGAHALAGITVGPLDPLWDRYTRAEFFATTWSWIGAATALFAAVVAFTIWTQRRDKVSPLLALASGFWLVHAAARLIEVMPASAQAAAEAAYAGGYAGFLAVAAIALLRWRHPVPRRVEWELAAAIAAGTGLLWFENLLDFPAIGDVALVNLAAPIALGAWAAVAIRSFVQSAHDAESAKEDLENRVREREQLLKRNYERLRESERLQAQSHERQRIMQDMHDGLGSQLMSSLMLVERGGVSPDQFAQILRESIDDMRLAIDALAAEDVDMAAALGNLRFRMEPRFRAAGVALSWDARTLPAEIPLHPDMVLPLLRIVQEALTNALKHSHARAVRVTLAATPGEKPDTGWLDIRVTDNGQGIAPDRNAGRGLLNMRNRAQKIGAQLRIDTEPGRGTTIALRMRFEKDATAGLRMRTTAPLNTQAIIEQVRRANPPTGSGAS